MMNEDMYYYEEMNLPMITDLEKENADNMEEEILYEIYDFCQYYTDVTISELVCEYVKNLTDGNIVDFFIYNWFEYAYSAWKNKEPYDDNDMTMYIYGILRLKIKKFKEPIDEKEADYQKTFRYIYKFLSNHT